MIPFGEQLVAARKAKGMTQDQLAAEINITRQGVSRWENGKSLPDAETLKRISQVLGYDFVTDEPIAVVCRKNSPVDAPAKAVPAETAAGKDKAARTAQSGRVKSLIRYALCLAVGLAVGCLMGVYPLLHPAQTDVAASAGDTLPPKSAQSTYQPEVTGQAFLTFISEEDPIRAVWMDANTAAWMFTITVKNTGDTNFTAQRFQQAMLNDAWEVAGVREYSAAAMGWGDGVIMPGCAIQFSGGFPVQQASGVRFTIEGVDANGVERTFTGEFQLAKEIQE